MKYEKMVFYNETKVRLLRGGQFPGMVAISK